jgi:hypothetical protein
VYKTTDYGQSWSLQVRGLEDPNGFVRVVREDPKRPGLLYAGTETGLYLSFDGGGYWQPFQLNLPVVPITDLTFRHNDLVAATAGRAFWILDDLSALQQERAEGNAVFLAAPRDTYRFEGGYSENPAPGLGQNPKSGVILDYYLPEAPDSTGVTLEILQGDQVVRTYSSLPEKDFKTWPGGPPKPEVLPAKPGYNRFVWDFRRDALPAVEKVFVMGDYRGSRLAPGRYTARLSSGSEKMERGFNLLPHPGVEASPADYKEQQETLLAIEGAIGEMHQGVNRLRSVSQQLKAQEKLLEGNPGAAALVEKGKALLERIKTWEESLIQPRQETFQDVINFNNRLNAELMELKAFVDVAEPRVTQGAKERLADLLKEWESLKTEQQGIVRDGMAEYNELYLQLGLPALILEEE